MINRKKNAKYKKDQEEISYQSNNIPILITLRF